MSSSKRAVSGLFWTIFGSVLNAIYQFISLPVLLHHFGRDQYGLIGLAFSINVYLALMDMGLSTGNIKFFSQWIVRNQPGRVSKLFQSSLLFYGTIGIINVLILAVAAFFSKDLWHLHGNQIEIVHHLFYVLMVSAFFGWISTLFDQFLRANEIIGWEQRLLIFVKILWIIILFLTVKYNLRVETYVMLTCFSSLLIIPFTIMRMRRLPIKVSFFPRYYGAIFKQILPYSLGVFAVGIFQYSANKLQPIILSFRADIGAVADFRILSAIAMFLGFMSVSFVGVLLPMATKAVVLGNKETKDKIAYDATKYLSTFLAVVIFAFVLVSKDFLQLYIGKKYINLDYLDYWLNIWVLMLLFSHNSAISSLVFAENKLRPIVYISAFSAVTSLTLAWFLIPRYKIGGIVLGYLFYCISQNSFWYLFYYRKILKLNVGRILLSSFFRPVFSVAVCAVITYFIMAYLEIQNGYLRIGVTGFIFIAIAGPIAYFVILNTYDRDFMKYLLKRNRGTKSQT